MGGFHVRAIISKAVMNMHVQVFLWMSIFISLGSIPPSIIVGLYGLHVDGVLFCLFICMCVYLVLK